MTYCVKCLRNVCTPCVPANDNRPRIIIVARDDELSRRSHFHRLAIATKALGLPRREIPNWIADVIYGFEGVVKWPGGKLFEVGDEDIDNAFNDDGSFRWLSSFMSFAEAPPRQVPQVRMLTRLRLIYLAFQIAHPERAALIAK